MRSCMPCNTDKADMPLHVTDVYKANEDLAVETSRYHIFIHPMCR